MLRHITYSFLFSVLVGLIGCTSKFDLGTIPQGGPRESRDTVYVENETAVWRGFNEPRALLVGNDGLFYVADYGKNRIVLINSGGQFLGSRGFMHPTAIGQDSRLDLLIAAELVRTTGDTVGAIFRFHVVRDRQGNFYGHDHFATAPIETIWTEASRPARRFSGIAVLPNNQFLVARSGPDNTSFIDPDARVLLYNSGDTLLTPLSDLITRSPAGSGITDINKPTGLIPFSGKRDFILTQSSDGGIVYGVVWMVYQLTAEFDGWVPKFDPTQPGSQSLDFVRPARFVEASGAAIDRAKGDIFVVDAQLDSIVKFDSKGRLRKESFGNALAKTTEFPDGLRNPRGVAFYLKTLYVVDTGHNVIRLFNLSTDLF